MILNAGKPGELYLGWTSLGGGYWGEAQRDECCFVQFQKGNRRIVALTEILSRSANGAVERKRIIDILKLTLESGEEEAADCSLDGKPVMVAYIDAERGTVRGVFTDGKRLDLRSWDYGQNPDCTVYEE